MVRCVAPGDRREGTRQRAVPLPARAGVGGRPVLQVARVVALAGRRALAYAGKPRYRPPCALIIAAGRLRPMAASPDPVALYTYGCSPAAVVSSHCAHTCVQGDSLHSWDTTPFQMIAGAEMCVESATCAAALLQLIILIVNVR